MEKYKRVWEASAKLRVLKTTTPTPRPMRATSLLRIVLALNNTRVTGFEFNDEALIVDVAPTFRIPRCSDCNRKVKAIHDRRTRLWRHLDLGGMKTRLRFSLRRVRCPVCGVKIEKVPWAPPGFGFTYALENHAAYLAQRSDTTTVTTLLRIAWRTVGSIVQRYVRRHEEGSGQERLDGLRLIGVDEISYRRHHQYITTVVDHEQGKVVWAAEGKSAKTLSKFFKALGDERSAKLEAVTIDMSGAFIKAISEASPEALIIFDRFHVQRLAHDALDEVRRDEVREAETKDDKEALKKTRWALQKNPWNLTSFETAKLENSRRPTSRCIEPTCSRNR